MLCKMCGLESETSETCSWCHAILSSPSANSGLDVLHAKAKSLDSGTPSPFQSAEAEDDLYDDLGPSPFSAPRFTSGPLNPKLQPPDAPQSRFVWRSADSQSGERRCHDSSPAR